MILVTTSRKPSRNTRVFARSFSNLLPCSSYIARGKRSVESLFEYAVSKGFSKIAVVQDRKGNPHGFEFISVKRNSWDWMEPMHFKGVCFSPVKKKCAEIMADEKFVSVFCCEPFEDAELSVSFKKNIEFVLNGEKIMVIKLN